MPTNKKKKSKKPSKLYRVNVDMKWSDDIVVKAKTAGEARKKAWAQFKRRCPRKLFELNADAEY